MMTFEGPLVESTPASLDDSVPARVGLATIQAAMKHVNSVILGKEEQVKLAFAALLVGGHVLLEDAPGTGKTVLAKALGSVMQLEFKRVQFTSDLLPSDILGVSIYQPAENRFELHPGPIFTNILLADEINRASPRTQSALLEAMAERQVSIDRATLPLPNPFIVLATQNEVDLQGTFPLPAAQRDRFLFQLSLGYPDAVSEIELMRQAAHGHASNTLIIPSETRLNAQSLLALRAEVHRVHMSEHLLDYCYKLVAATRSSGALSVGLSTRASLALVSAAQAWAFLDDRSYVKPEDVQKVLMPLAIHRVLAKPGMAQSVRQVLLDLLDKVPCP